MLRPVGERAEAVSTPDEDSLAAGAIYPDVRATTITPEDAPTECTRCGRPLTVGERMFYFLEGTGPAALCRSCLAVGRDGGPEDLGGAPEVISWSRVDAPTASLPGDRPEDLETAVRSFLREEFDRIDVALDRIPDVAPDLPLARSLRKEAEDRYFARDLPEAILLLRDLRRILSGLEMGRKRPALTAPWDESVEELFDRVQARASAMIRPSPGIPTEDEDEVPIAIPGRRQGPRTNIPGRHAASD